MHVCAIIKCFGMWTKSKLVEKYAKLKSIILLLRRTHVNDYFCDTQKPLFKFNLFIYCNGNWLTWSHLRLSPNSLRTTAQRLPLKQASSQGLSICGSARENRISWYCLKTALFLDNVFITQWSNPAGDKLGMLKSAWKVLILNHLGGVAGLRLASVMLYIHDSFSFTC